MPAEQELKQILWRGDSRKIAHNFPKGGRLKIGKELTRIQNRATTTRIETSLERGNHYES
jgi:hypothetical protein